MNEAAEVSGTQLIVPGTVNSAGMTHVSRNVGTTRTLQS